MANVSVIGAGSWGLALARRLCKNGHDVTVWSHLEEGVRELREQHENRASDNGLHRSAYRRNCKVFTESFYERSISCIYQSRYAGD